MPELGHDVWAGFAFNDGGMHSYPLRSIDDTV